MRFGWKRRFYDTSEPELVEITVSQRPKLSIECEDVRVHTGDPPLELNCTPSLDVPLRDGPPDYLWSWTSENGMNLLSGDLTSAMPVFNVPADQDPPTAQYTYQVTASAEYIDSPQNPATLTVTVEKYPIILECPEEVIVTVGMPPQQIACSATNDQDAALDYVWQWTPTERLSGTSTGTPLFDVPTRQRVLLAYLSVYGDGFGGAWNLGRGVGVGDRASPLPGSGGAGGSQ